MPGGKQLEGIGTYSLQLQGIGGGLLVTHSANAMRCEYCRFKPAETEKYLADLREVS